MTINLPGPKGALSGIGPSAAIASASAEIRHCVTTRGQLPYGQRQQHYNSYTPEQKPQSVDLLLMWVRISVDQY